MSHETRCSAVVRRYAKAAAVELPIPPVLLCRMIALMDDPNRDANRIAEVLASDPGLGAEALRIANSAAYAFRNPVTNVRQAVVALGERLLRELIARRMRAILGGPSIPGYANLHEGLWRHAIRTAAAAARLAPRGPVSAGVAYTGGLLADIGKLALAAPLHKRWDAVEAALRDPNLSFDQIERDVLGADHGEVGAEMARRWKLPPVIIAAIASHHSPAAARPEFAVIANVVHVADLVALLSGAGGGSDGLHYNPSPSAVKALGVNEMELAATMADVEQDVAHLEELLVEQAA